MICAMQTSIRRGLLFVLLAAAVPAAQDAPSTYSDPWELIEAADFIIDRSTTADPKALSEGVHTVWTNGQAVFQKRETTTRRPGLVLRRETR